MDAEGMYVVTGALLWSKDSCTLVVYPDMGTFASVSFCILLKKRCPGRTNILSPASPMLDEGLCNLCVTTQVLMQWVASV